MPINPINRYSKGVRELTEQIEELTEETKLTGSRLKENTQALKKIEELKKAADQKLFQMKLEALDNYEPRPLVRTSEPGMKIAELDLLKVHENEIKFLNLTNKREINLRDQEAKLADIRAEYQEHEVEMLKKKLDIL
jgi:hypothetical protein